MKTRVAIESEPRCTAVIKSGFKTIRCALIPHEDNRHFSAIVGGWKAWATSPGHWDWPVHAARGANALNAQPDVIAASAMNRQTISERDNGTESINNPQRHILYKVKNMEDYPYMHHCVDCGKMVGCRDLLSRNHYTIHYGVCGHTVALTYNRMVWEQVFGNK